MGLEEDVIPLAVLLHDPCDIVALLPCALLAPVAGTDDDQVLFKEFDAIGNDL